MNKKYVILVLAIIGVGVLYKRSLQTMDSEEPSPKRARLTTTSQDNSEPVPQEATPSEAASGEQITFIASDGQRVPFARDAAMKLGYVRDNSEAATILGQDMTEFSFSMISGSQMTALVPIINDLSATTNLDNLVIKNLKDKNLDFLITLIYGALFLDEELGHSIARLCIFKLLQNSPDKSYEAIAADLRINNYTLWTNDYEIVKNSAGFKGLCCHIEIVEELTPQLMTLSLAYSGFTNLYGLSLIPNINNVQRLYLSNNQITELSVGTFNGLSNLRILYLHNNQLTELPANIFTGLSSLESLHLDNNRLAVLPDNIFTGLTNLKLLSLHDNRLTALPDNIFTGLSKLELLNLDNNRLAVFPDNIFTGLSNLKSLSLSSNQLTTLPAGVFTGLTNLKSLFLHDNRLTALPDNIFTGLTNLTLVALHDNPIPLTAEQIKQQYFPANSHVRIHM